MNTDDIEDTNTYPPEIEDLYSQKLVTQEELEPMLKFRKEFIRAAPQPRTEFQSELSQYLQGQIDQRQRPSFNTALSKRFPARFAIVAVTLLVFGVGVVVAVNAVLQQFISYDAGLNAVFNANGGIELNMSQTTGNYTVNLQWANADRNRLTVGFDVTGFNCSESYVSCNVFVSVFDQNGIEVPLLDGRADDRLNTTRTYLYNFDLSNFTTDAPTYGFRLKVIPYGTVILGASPDNPAVMQTRSEHLNEAIQLDFNIPLSNEVRLMNEPLSVTDAGITVTLRRVTVSRSQTRVAICFAPPELNRSWTATSRLTAGQAEVTGGGAVQPVTGIGESERETCNEFIYNAPMFDYVESWQFEITELVGFGSSGANQQRIPGAWDFQFEVP